MSRKYIWWASPEEMLEIPHRIAIQVMNMGSFRDVEKLVAALGDDVLRRLLRRAEAGQFAVRSWHYWHYRLGLAEPEQVPPMPVKHIPAA